MIAFYYNCTKYSVFLKGEEEGLNNKNGTDTNLNALRIVYTYNVNCSILGNSQSAEFAKVVGESRGN